MGMRQAGEPEYPRTKEEVDKYCECFVRALRSNLGNRLVCVLLCGSWARGEAHPPESDVDVTVVVDTVDDEVSDALRQAWVQSNMGCANVYGADEVKAMSREALEMYTTNAVVLWGTNPFSPPSKDDFAEDLARAAENLGRDVRCVDFYHWQPMENKIRYLKDTISSKYRFIWTLKCFAAFRTGTFPRNHEDLRKKLFGTSEAELLRWVENLTEEDYCKRYGEIARRLSLCARDWMREILPVRNRP